MTNNLDKSVQERAEEAKQETLKAEKDLQLKYGGFEKIADGYSFPDINITLVNKAIEKRTSIKPHEVLEP
jgi:hypothetical protein